MQPNEIIIKGIDGVKKKYCFIPLTKKEANYVLYTLTGSAIESAGGSMEALRELVADLPSDMDKEAARAIVEKKGWGAVLTIARSYFKAVPHEVFWDVASRVLRGCTILSEAKVVKIENLDDCDYFDDCPDEMFIAVARGLGVSYGNFFKRLKAAMPKKPPKDTEPLSTRATKD